MYVGDKIHEKLKKSRYFFNFSSKKRQRGTNHETLISNLPRDKLVRSFIKPHFDTFSHYVTLFRILCENPKPYITHIVKKNDSTYRNKAKIKHLLRCITMTSFSSFLHQFQNSLRSRDLTPDFNQNEVKFFGDLLTFHQFQGQM